MYPNKWEYGDTYDYIDPVAYMYVNGELRSARTMNKEYVGDGYIYETVLSGLNYDDTYQIIAKFEDEEGNVLLEVRSAPRRYIGNNGSPPTLSVSGNRIEASQSAPYNKTYSMPVGVLSFNSDYGELNSYSREARDLLYASCLQYTEYDAILGKVGNFMSFWVDQGDSSSGYPSAFTTEAFITKFSTSDFPLKVGIASSASTWYYSEISHYVNLWISEINKLIGDTVFIRDDSIGAYDSGIRITIGSHEDLWGYNPDRSEEDEIPVYLGSWACTRWYPSIRAIQHCEVKICNELRAAILDKGSFQDIVYEELTECLGCGNDCFNTFESMFSEIWYPGKRNRLIDGGYPTVDGEVVQMLYNELELGELASSVIHKLTPSQGACIQLPNIKRGIVGYDYSIRAFSINRQVTYGSDGFYWNSTNNSFSNVSSDYITISPALINPWDWSVSNGEASDYQTQNSLNALLSKDGAGNYNGNTTDFHHKVWNDMVDKIAEILDHSGCTWKNDYATFFNTKMTSADKKLTAQRFNALVYNMNSYFPFIADGCTAARPTGLPIVSKGDPVLAWYFTTIATRANQWIDTL